AWREIPRVFLRTLLPLMMPVVLLGGIYSGAFTPTEAAAVAALYALVLALFVYRVLDWKGLVSVLAESARSTAVVSVIICGAFMLNYVLATEQIPERVAAWFASLQRSEERRVGKGFAERVWSAREQRAASDTGQ